MSVAIPIPLLQNLPDVNVTPAVGVDEYALVWDNDTARFALRAKAALDANGNLQLAATSYIYQGSLPLLHNYTAPGSTGANIFVGLGVGNFTMSGTGNEASGNTAIGTSAFTANTKGAFNVAVGVHAMEANTIGISNTAVGAGAMYKNVSGSQNTAVGDTSMGENVSGGYNVAIGDSALQNGVTGSYNTAVGQGALASTTESSNAGVGVNSLFYNTIGVGNTAVGSFSGMSLSDVNRNTISDYYMTFVGYKSSRSSSVPNTQQLVNAMALGYDAEVDESNKVVLGNALVTKTVLRGNVGIGTTSPATALHVVGAATITGGIRPHADSTTAIQLKSTGGTVALNVNTTDGRVSVGTTDTQYAKLSVHSGPIASLWLQSDYGYGYQGALNDSWYHFHTDRPYFFFSTGISVDSGVVAAYGSNDLSLRTNTDTRIFVKATSGNVGIGTTSPAEALDVTGNANVTGVYKVDDVQVLSNRVIDARCADVANSGDATTDGLIDALRDALVAHGLIAAS